MDLGRIDIGLFNEGGIDIWKICMDLIYDLMNPNHTLSNTFSILSISSSKEWVLVSFFSL